MGRSIVACGFATLLVVGIIAAIAGNPFAQRLGQGVSDEPPEVFVFFDEEATAEFDQAAAARETRNRTLIGLAITIGLSGLIVSTRSTSDAAPASSVA